jgi:membrane protease YdiL (CAAX protease family)
LKFMLEGYWVYLTDYVIRTVIFSFVLMSLERQNLWKKTFSVKMAILGGGLLTVLNIIYRIVHGQPWESFFDHYFFHPIGYPKIENNILLAFDLSIGLLLVALSEEAVYRVLFSKWAEHRKWSTVQLYAYSSFWFALLHLPQGLTSTVNAAVYGLAFMFFYRKTGSYLFVVICHYFVNLWVFGSWYYWYADLIPTP